MKVVKQYLNIWIRVIIRCCMRILYILPIRSNRIIFESFEGLGYNCSLKYISEYFHEKDPSIELVWAFVHPDQFDSIPGIVRVKYKSLKWLYYRITSKVVIFNTNLIIYIPRRKNQLFINTWHAGGAYKRTSVPVGSDIFLNWCFRTMASSEISIYLSSSELFTKYNIMEAHSYTGEILNAGLPRNDMFFDEKKIADNNQKIRQAYGIDRNTLVVLYAPTFRGIVHHGKKIEQELDIPITIHALEQRYHRSVKMLVRYHHWDKNNYGLYEDAISVSEYPDMQELLCCADVLITDYSSSIWDYALTGRPCFLYVPDLHKYADIERGLYMPIETWAGIICKNMEELQKKIITLDEDQCRRIAKNHLETYGSYETGHATEIIYNRINNFLKRT